MQNTFFQQNRELFSTARDTLQHCTMRHADLCRMAMDNILSRTADYDAMDIVPKHILQHTKDMIQELPHPDALFGLLEDLALITRGRTLFANEEDMKEKKVLEHFENLGEWTLGDGTLISDWYWLRLPALAMTSDKTQRQRLLQYLDRQG